MKTLRLPSIEAVASALRNAKRSLNKGINTDVRLQVYDNGQWALRIGLSDYDQDHRGFWGASSVDSGRCDTRAIAKDLLEQVREAIAQNTDN